MAKNQTIELPCMFLTWAPGEMVKPLTEQLAENQALEGLIVTVGSVVLNQ